MKSGLVLCASAISAPSQSPRVSSARRRIRRNNDPGGAPDAHPGDGPVPATGARRGRGAQARGATSPQGGPACL
jgi:hypothetical protein